MLGKSLAAGLLGLPLSVALVGLVVLLAPGTWALRTLPMLLLFFPIWVGVMSGAFLFRNGRRAWACMGTVTIVCFALMYLLKTMGFVSIPG